MIINISRSKILKIFCDKHYFIVRYKSSQKKILAKDRALEHFDEFYQQVFNDKWTSIRRGLLGKQKYVAVINNYSDTDKIMSTLENCGALNMRALFHARKRNLEENNESVKQDKFLKRIFQLDKKLDENSKIEQVNPDELNESNVLEKQIDKYKLFSLEYQKSQAKLDMTRMIDANVGLGASTLKEFVPCTQIKGKEDWIYESEYFDYGKQRLDFKVKVEKEYDFNFPEHLHVYCFPESSSSSFTQPRKGSTGVLNYYILDGGSVLPVLALDIRPGNTVLDMCASPGGKTLMVLQTLYPDCVVSNDISKSRTDRIYKVLNEYLYDLEERWFKMQRVKITQNDGRCITDGRYDRILVDVPCTTDRHSVKENDNNIFKTTRVKERLKLPEMQTDLLSNAFKLVKKGGIVVYSTCSLSPVQNDGVVHMALQKAWEENGIEIVVKNLNYALVQTQDVFKMADVNIYRYGNLVLPNICQNYGPMYFCKFERIN